MKSVKTLLNGTKSLYWQRLAEAFGKDEIGTSVLDVGCGDAVAEWNTLFSSADCITGLDTSFPGAPLAPGTAYVRGHSQSLPFVNGAFDTVFCKDVLHHIEPRSDDALIAILREMYRTSRKNVIIVEANRFHPIELLYMVLSRRHNHLSRKQLRRITGRAFSQEPVMIQLRGRELDHVPFGPMFLYRVLKRLETFVESIELLSGFLSYNIVLVNREIGAQEHS